MAKNNDKFDFKPSDNDNLNEIEKKTHTSDIDESIIKSLNEGDQNAFEYIYLHYYDSLTNFLTSLLKSRKEAEEISQEIFLNLWLKRGIFDPAKGIKRYLYQQAKFHAFNHFDKKKVKEKYEIFYTHTSSEQDIAADDIVESKETALLIEIAISRMPPRQREAFKLSREQNLSYEEIASHLGISKNKVRNYISASLKELREVLALCFVLLNF